MMSVAIKKERPPMPDIPEESAVFVPLIESCWAHEPNDRPSFAALTDAEVLQPPQAPSEALQPQMAQVLQDNPGLMVQAHQIAQNKFLAPNPTAYTTAEAADSRKGIVSFMCVNEDIISDRKKKKIDGLREEIASYVAAGLPGAAQLKECLDYVLDEEAGQGTGCCQNCDRDEKGVLRERTRGGRGMRLDDFFADDRVAVSALKIEHIAALRLYTTLAYQYINDPLRDEKRREDGRAHPLPYTVKLIEEACKQLGAAAYELEDDADKPKDLYRGMRNVEVPEDFLRKGGSEIAVMSTTTSLNIAMEFSMSQKAVLLRIKTNRAIERGVDIKWLSVYPREKEVLYGPLTYLHAEGELEQFELEGQSWTVVTVAPTIS
jgi:hypothetical protein